MLATNKSIYHFGEFHLETSARLLARKGERVPLGSKAFEVLLCLVQHPGEVVSKDVLLKTVWPNSFVEDNNLSQHIFSLRKALADRADYIVTVPGRGYQFAGRVLEIAPAVPKQQVAELPSALVEAVLERSVVQEEVQPPGVHGGAGREAPAWKPEGMSRWLMWSLPAAVVVGAAGVGRVDAAAGGGQAGAYDGCAGGVQQYNRRRDVRPDAAAGASHSIGAVSQGWRW